MILNQVFWGYSLNKKSYPWFSNFPRFFLQNDSQKVANTMCVQLFLNVSLRAFKYYTIVQNQSSATKVYNSSSNHKV